MRGELILRDEISIAASKGGVIHQIRYQLCAFALRNAVAVLFRVFVELSIELYLEKHQVPYNDNDKLAKKAESAITHMKEKAWADAKVVKGIQAGISSPHNPLSFNTFNAYVHNRHFHPSPQELATAWDNAQPCLDVLFNHLT